MDFSAWFEVFLGGRWFTFDARHNTPRIGRILMARGRDAADVAITTSFGAVPTHRLPGERPTKSLRHAKAGAEAVARHAIDAQVSKGR